MARGAGGGGEWGESWLGLGLRALLCTTLPPNLDPGPGHSLCAEEHQEEQRGEGLGLVETLYHRAAPHRGTAVRGADPEQRRT